METLVPEKTWTLIENFNNKLTFTVAATAVQYFQPLQTVTVAYDLTSAVWTSFGLSPNVKLFYGVRSEDNLMMATVTAQSGSVEMTIPLVYG